MKALSAADLRCPATDKQAYADKATANFYLERVYKMEIRRKMPARSYRCAECGWWHLTADPRVRDYEEAQLE